MTLVVVDASVAFKWLVEEHNSNLAGRLRANDWELCAPDVLPAEVGHALRRRVIRGLLDRALAALAVETVASLPVALASSGALLPAAFDIAITRGIGVYDALYLALALGEDCHLVTADRKLRDAVKSVHPGVVLLEELLPG